MARPSAPWSVRDLRRKCESLREQLTIAAEGLVTPEEMADYWPGGKENSLEKAGSRRGQWIWCYASLVRLCDRLRPDTVDDAAAESARVDAMVDRPVPVTLDSGEVVCVFPKGYVALEYLTWLDREVLRATELASALVFSESVEAHRAVSTVPLVRSLAVQLWAWILTVPPEDGVPFDPFRGEDPTPPAWTTTMSERDLIKLFQAHRAVNATRNALVAQLFPDEPKASVRLSLAGFIGAYAHEKGMDSGRLMDRFAVGKIFAQAVGAAQQHDAAMKRAKDPAEAA